MKYLQFLWIFCLIIGLLSNSWIEFEKFLEEKTMSTIYDDSSFSTLELPMVTICANPPFKVMYEIDGNLSIKCPNQSILTPKNLINICFNQNHEPSAWYLKKGTCSSNTLYFSKALENLII